MPLVVLVVDLAHERGWKISRDESGSVIVEGPGGGSLRSAAPVVEIDDAAVDVLLEGQAELAISSDCLPVWQGDTLDLDWTIAGIVQASHT